MRFRTTSWLGAGQCIVLGQQFGRDLPRLPTHGYVLRVDRKVEPCGVIEKKVTQVDAHGTVTFYGYESSEEKRP